MYIGDMRIFEDYVHRFVSYVKENEMNDAPISFVNESGFLYKEEGYKYRIAKEAKAILNCDEWNESWIGDGRIRQRIFKTMGLASNLVNFNSIIDFKNHFKYTCGNCNYEFAKADRCPECGQLIRVE